jgi:hypothetical protein
MGRRPRGITLPRHRNEVERFGRRCVGANTNGLLSAYSWKR